MPPTLSPRVPPLCGPHDNEYANVNDIIACFQYLLNLGSKPCKSTRNLDGNRLCQAGGAQIFVWSLYGNKNVLTW